MALPTFYAPFPLEISKNRYEWHFFTLVKVPIWELLYFPDSHPLIEKPEKKLQVSGNQDHPREFLTFETM